MNETVITGRMTKDAELMKTDSGRSYVHFTVAVDRTYGADKQTDFIPCTAWNATAENLCRYCGKGSLVGVSGRLQTRTYENSQGMKVNAMEVVANSVEFLESRKSGQSSQKNESQYSGWQNSSYSSFSNENDNLNLDSLDGLDGLDGLDDEKIPF